jgi:hypothetical protein
LEVRERRKTKGGFAHTIAVGGRRVIWEGYREEDLSNRQ